MGFRVQGSVLSVSCFVFSFQDLGFRVWGLGFEVNGPGLRV